MASELDYAVCNALTLPVKKTYLWTDSATVLSWITNTSRRTKVFVYNQRRTISRYTDPTQWGYVHTQCNPADLGTRILSPKKASSDCLWLTGPDYLCLPREVWPTWNIPQANSEDLKLIIPDGITTSGTN